MKITLLSLLIHGTVTQCSYGFDAGYTGPGMAGAATDGFWSMLNNQAGLAGYRSLAFGIMTERRFLLSETSVSAVVLAVPVRPFTMGVSYRQAGFALFREIMAGLALARYFGDRVGVGLQLDYKATRIGEGYGKARGVTFETGFRILVSEALTLAIHAVNPLALNYKENEGESPETRISLGALYRIKDQVSISVEVVKDFRFRPVIRAGMEYRLSRMAVIHAGYSSLPPPASGSSFSQMSRLCFGYGLELKRIRLDIGASLHTITGWSPAASARYEVMSFE